MPRRAPDPRIDRRALARAVGRCGAARLVRAGRLGAKHGWPVYLVGGVVRDLLLGRATRDLDLVVVGDARGLARLLARGAGGSVREHADFGTASLDLPDGAKIDLATARAESYPRPAALPVPVASDLQHDLRRRDFSINAMALDLAPAAFGRLVDPLEGRTDLRRRLIRALHERSFEDDPTRAFRAVRFAARLGFSVEPGTRRALRRAAAAGTFDRLSSARLLREVTLLFDEPRWDETARLLGSLGLWAALDPVLAPRPGDRTRLQRLERWTLRCASGAAAPPAWVVALADLTRDFAPGERARLVARLRPRRREARDLLCAAEDARRVLAGLRASRTLPPSAARRLCRGASPTALLLALLDSRPGRVRRQLIARLCSPAEPRADIRGTDLLRAGIPPGPAIARGLEAALAAKLDGEAPGRADQLRVALRAARRLLA